MREISSTISREKKVAEKIKVRHRYVKNVGKRRAPTNKTLTPEKAVIQESES